MGYIKTVPKDLIFALRDVPNKKYTSLGKERDKIENRIYTLQFRAAEHSTPGGTDEQAWR